MTVLRVMFEVAVSVQKTRQTCVFLYNVGEPCFFICECNHNITQEGHHKLLRKPKERMLDRSKILHTSGNAI